MKFLRLGLPLLLGVLVLALIGTLSPSRQALAAGCPSSGSGSAPYSCTLNVSAGSAWEFKGTCSSASCTVYVVGPDGSGGANPHDSTSGEQWCASWGPGSSSSGTLTFKITNGTTSFSDQPTSNPCSQGGGGKPDLVPNSAIGINGTLESGQTLTFFDRVHNVGNAAAGASTSVFRLDGNGLGRADTPALGVDAVSARQASDQWVATKGIHTIRYCVDVGNQVAESNEANNCTSRSFTVKGPSQSIKCAPGNGITTVSWSFSGNPDPVSVFKNGSNWLGVVNSPGSHTDDQFTAGGNQYDLVEDGNSIASVSGCNPSPPVATAQPYLTTIFGDLGNPTSNPIPTYGDIHAGGFNRVIPNTLTRRNKKDVIDDCTDPAATTFVQDSPKAINGSLSLSGSPTAVSASGPINEFGGGGSTNPGSVLRLGNQILPDSNRSDGLDANSNYAFPICQFSGSDEFGSILAYTTNVYPRPSPSSKSKRIRNLADDHFNFNQSNPPDNNVVYIGSTKGNDGDACGSEKFDDNKIVELLQAAPGTSVKLPGPGSDPNKTIIVPQNLMIYCDVREAVRDNPAPPYCASHPDDLCLIEQNAHMSITNPNGPLPIAIKGHKTLYILALPYRTSCPGGSAPCVDVSNSGYTNPIGSNIIYANSDNPSGYSSVKDVPTFALVDSANLSITKGVTQLDGYFFAGVKKRQRAQGHYFSFQGFIKTCPKSPKTNPQYCPQPLQVHGMLSALQLFFWRTGTTSTPAEQIGGSEYGLLFTGTPPPGLSQGVPCTPDPSNGITCTSNLDFSQTEQPPIH